MTLISREEKNRRDAEEAAFTAICIGGPLQGRRFHPDRPPAGYHRVGIERGYLQGTIIVLEQDGGNCLVDLVAAVERYGKIREDAGLGGRCSELAVQFSGKELDDSLDAEEFEE